MYPVFGKIGPFTIYSFGVMLAAAVVICSFLLARDAAKKKIDPTLIYDLSFWLILGGIVGARLFYILLNFGYFLHNPGEIIMIQNGGLAWQGGFIFGALSGYLFVRKHKLSFWPMVDLTAPYLALGQSIGRVGCFLNGCCFGKPVAWGVFCPIHGERLHPAQLYEAVGLFVVFLFLKQVRKKSSFEGQTFFSYILMAAGLRFANEFFRGDHAQTWLGLSIYQYVCLALLILGSYGYTYFKSRRR